MFKLQKSSHLPINPLSRAQIEQYLSKAKKRRVPYLTNCLQTTLLDAYRREQPPYYLGLSKWLHGRNKQVCPAVPSMFFFNGVCREHSSGNGDTTVNRVTAITMSTVSGVGKNTNAVCMAGKVWQNRPPIGWTSDRTDREPLLVQAMCQSTCNADRSREMSTETSTCLSHLKAEACELGEVDHAIFVDVELPEYLGHLL